MNTHSHTHIDYTESSEQIKRIVQAAVNPDLTLEEALREACVAAKTDFKVINLTDRMSDGNRLGETT